jgi:Ser/Thr protein kinase RdoA (MazF antagonist)
MRPPIHVSQEMARSVLELAGLSLGPDPRLRREASGNTVWRIDTGDSTLFLKIPTKDLDAAADSVAVAAAKVTCEQSGSACLRRHGLPGPVVLAAGTDSANPVGRPYLLTRQVAGDSFTSIVPVAAGRESLDTLEAVGEFLARVHGIEFPRAGYLTTAEGPGELPSVLAPRGSHSPQLAHAEAIEDLDQARSFLDAHLLSELESRFSGIAEELGDEYRTPSFVIGSFHPNHAFLARSRGRWEVSGCVDLEVASAGSVLEDLTTIAVGLMVRFSPDAPWWEPLFCGYGSEPSLERMRLALLSCATYCFGGDPPSAVPRRLAQTYRAMLSASSWAELFDSHRTGLGP